MQDVKECTKCQVVLYNTSVHLGTRYVGLQLREHKVSLTERQCMNFAAGIGEANPIYYDDELPGGLLVHPLLATAITWQVAGRIWEFLPPSDFPTHLLLTQIHYSEHLQFHTPLRPGMHLALQGKIAAILPHRAGTQVVVCFEALLPTGEKVFTEYITGLLRGVTCEPPGAGVENLADISKQPETNAGPLWVETFTLSELAPYIYDACADIHFPIHTSPRFAHQVGLPGVIVQGTQTLARAVSILLQCQASGNPRSLSILACRFAAVVFPGETLQLRLHTQQPSPQGAHLFFDVLKANGEAAIRLGYCRLLPGPKD